MNDLTRLQQRLQPKPDGESAVRHRTGTVTAVNSDGTVDLDLGGVVVPDVSVLNGVLVAVGTVVQVLVWAGDMLVIGGVGTPTRVKARILNTTVTTFAASATRTVSTNIIIPADWNTYDIEIGFTAWLTSTTLTARNLIMTPRLAGAGVAGQDWQHQITSTYTTKNEILSGTGFWEGETVTGSRTVDILFTLNTTDALVATDNVVVIGTAYRTS